MTTARIVLSKAGRRKGLGKDAEIFRKYLETKGFSVVTEHTTIANIIGPDNGTIYDLQIFLENIVSSYLPYGRYNALMVNQDISFIGPAEAVDIYICKTRYCHQKLRNFLTKRELDTPIIFTSFFTPSTGNFIKEKKPFALHAAGESPYKSTLELMGLWKRHPEWPPLHVIGSKWHNTITADNIVTYSEYLSSSELDQLQRSAYLYVCPSTKEGWGHYIDEGRINAAPIIATNAPPMNELCRYSSLLVDVGKMEEDLKILHHNLDAHYFYFDEKSMEHAMGRFLAMTPQEREEEGLRNLRAYQEDKDYFENKGMKEITDMFENYNTTTSYINNYTVKSRKNKLNKIFLTVFLVIVVIVIYYRKKK